MKVFIIGSSSAGLFLSIYLKIAKPSLDVFAIEKNEQIAKKMYATGNGRCNITNLNLIDEAYNSDETNEIVKNFDALKIIDYLNNKLGILTTSIDGLIYPYSLSAKSFVDSLIKNAKELGVKFLLNEKLIDYKINENINIKTSNADYIADFLIFATGGKSSPNLGSDGNIFSILEKHNYEISSLKAGLTPIKVNEKLAEIENERLKTVITLKIDEKIYKEEGEVIFKKDRISGIVSFNVSSIIKRYLLRKNTNDISLSLDLMPDFSEDSLVKLLNNFKKVNENFLEGIFSKRIASFLNKRFKKEIDSSNLEAISKGLMNLEFTYKYDDDFASSQVTVGGVEYLNLNSELESKNEKNTYFIGEILNADGLCGGYNITFAFASAKKAADSIIKKIN